MSGPWEKYKKAGSAKPWEKYAAQKVSDALPVEEDDGSGNAFVEGIGRGIPVLGSYLDKISAGAAKGLAKGYDFLHGTKVSDAMGDYDQVKADMEKDTARMQSQHPYASGAGNIVGGLATGGLTNAALEGAGLVGQSATALGRMKNAGIANAMLGAFENPNIDNGSFSENLEARGENALGQGALGLAGGGIAEGATKIAKPLAGLAEKAAVKALGPYARSAMQLFDRGKVNSMGRTILDENIIGKMPASYEKLAERVAAAAKGSGEDLGELLKKLDKAAVENGLDVGISRAAVAKSLEGRLVNEGMQDVAGIPEKNARMMDRIKQFSNGAGDDSMNLLETEAKKRAINKEINYKRLPGADIPEPEEYYRGLSGELRKGGEAAANKIEQALPEQFKQGGFEAAKNRFGNLDEAESILDKRNAKEFANRFLSPSDYGVGLAGAVAGGALSEGHSPSERLEAVLAGGALGLANKGARKYGNQILAKGADSLSKSLSNPAGKLGTLSSVLSAYEQNKRQPTEEAPSEPGIYDDKEKLFGDYKRLKQTQYVSPKDAADKFQNSQ